MLLELLFALLEVILAVLLLLAELRPQLALYFVQFPIQSLPYGRALLDQYLGSLGVHLLDLVFEFIVSGFDKFDILLVDVLIFGLVTLFPFYLLLLLRG